MNLSAVAEPAGAVLSSPQWNIGGSKIKNYTQAVDKAEVTELPSADLQQSAVGFYFTNGGIAGTEVTVSFEGKVDGVRAKAKAKLKVFLPNLTSFTSQWSNATPQPWDVRNGALMLGDFPVLPGITWTSSTTLPANGAGELAYVQLVNTGRSFRATNGVVTGINSNGQHILDDGIGTGVSYGLPGSAGGGATVTYSENDSPNSGLSGGDEYASIDDKFKLYLMYRPAGANSIYVTLGLLSWNAKAEANKNALTGFQWRVAGGASPAAGGAGPTGAKSTELPTWNDSVSALRARNGF